MTTGEVAQSNGYGDPGPSLFEAVTPIVRFWKRFLCIVLGFVVAAIVLTLLTPRKYTAVTSITPTTSSADKIPGSLASLAGQFGVSIGGGGSASPDFFAQLLTTREILTASLYANFADPKTGRARRLIDILNPDGDNNAEREAEGVRLLTKAVSANADKRTGVVTLAVTLRYPALAADVANRMVELLNEFNLKRLQLQSREQRRFSGERLAQAESELNEAENRLLAFLQANRSYSSSPLLTFEKERLERVVQSRQDIALALRREFEQARIAEVRDTPVLTTIDRAVAPTKKSAPSGLLNLMLGAVLGIVVGLIAVYASAVTAAAARGDWRGYSDLSSSVRVARGELASLIGRSTPTRDSTS
jgi:uncharacterized protein involved in exopolysaccharide biosynthesis